MYDEFKKLDFGGDFCLGIEQSIRESFYVLLETRDYPSFIKIYKLNSYKRKIISLKFARF